jgi:hypothetical protein
MHYSFSINRYLHSKDPIPEHVISDIRNFRRRGKSTGEIIEMIFDKHIFCYYPKNTTNEAYSALVSYSNRLLMNRQKLVEFPSFLRI